jgi:type II secretory pathway component PulF
LRNAGEFPDEFLNMLETAEISGALSESMLLLSEEYSRRAESATRVLVTFATYAIWGAVATVIVILIFKLAMFYIGILQGALRDAQGF